MSNIKFRPSLSLDEIKEILSLLHPSSHLHKKLSTFILKANVGIVKGSHVTSTPTTLSESLGFSTQSATQDDISTLLKAYEDGITLTNVQLSQVQHHRYLNDMMTPEEEAQYESSTSM